MIRKFLSLFLCAAMLVLACACSAPDGENAATTEAASASVTDAPAPVDTTPENERDTLPEMKFSNETYTILSRKNTVYEIEADDISGDIVKDAVFKRNADVSERFAVKLEVLTEPGEWGDRTSFVQRVGNVWMSGGESYDLIMTHSAYIVNIGISGYAYDMNTMDEIDFSKRWWCPQYTDNVNIDGMIFSAVGDLTYSLYERLQCMFFNKGLASASNIPDLYELVNSKQWTFDKLKEITLLVGEDLDGNGKYDENDRYGMGINNHTCRAFQTSFDTQMTVKDGDGRQTLNLPNDRYVDIFTDVYNYVWGNPQVRWDNDADSQAKLFMDDKLLLFAGRLGNAVTMKDMTSEYGIIPFPMYNTDQGRYISCARDYMTAMAIFGKLQNPVKTAVVTEALCMYGFQSITPSYYETALKFKYLKDPTAMGMLDIIRDNLTFDFAMTYTAQIDTFFSLMGDNIQNQLPAVANYCKGRVNSWNAKITELYENYEKLK